MQNAPQTYELRTDVRGLIRLLAKNLYAKSDVFLRELVQNAQDSIMRRREIEGRQAPAGAIQIRVDWSRDQPTITFEDNGAGLTEAEIHDYLSTIGRSGTDAFRRELEQKGRYAASASLIGQFGIGLLSTFVVAARVVVETRSCRPGHPTWRWECWGDKDYTLVSSAEERPAGARVTLYIDAEHRDLLDLALIRKAVKTYADFIPVPIQLNHELRINAVDAPWHRSYSSERERIDEYLAFIDRRVSDIPLAVIPIDLGDAAPARGVLYISSRRRSELAAAGRVDIYQSRMFLAADHPDLLPPWARFIGGVIDSPALTPTAARDNVQQDHMFHAVREGLGRAIIDHLRRMAVEDLRNFQQIMHYHHYAIKGVALEADDFFREVAELLPFETNQGLLSLREYLDRAPLGDGGRRTILYFSEHGQATQFFLLADARDILVINAGYVHEERFLKKYERETPNVALEQLGFAESSSIFQQLPPAEQPPYQALVAEFQRQLPTAGSRARLVRFQPAHIPAVVTLSEAQKLKRQMDALRESPIVPSGIRSLLDQVAEERPEIPVTVHLNADNPTIRALAGMDLRAAVAVEAMKAIYTNAIMLAQHLITPKNAELIFTQSSRVVDLLIAQAREVALLRAQIHQLEQAAQARPAEAGPPAHTVCAVMFDVARRGQIFEALQALLQDQPYCWEVVRAGEGGAQPGLSDQLRQAHGLVVEVSDDNPHVLAKLRLFQEFERPCLLLRERAAPASARLAGARPEPYDGTAPPEALRDQLQAAIERQASFRELLDRRQARYLSPTLLRDAPLRPELGERICRSYRTVEAFLAADPAAVEQQTTVQRRAAALLQDYLRDSCGLEGAGA